MTRRSRTHLQAWDPDLTLCMLRNRTPARLFLRGEYWFTGDLDWVYRVDDPISAHQTCVFGVRATGGLLPSFSGGLHFRAEMPDNTTIDFAIVGLSRCAIVDGRNTLLTSQLSTLRVSPIP